MKKIFTIAFSIFYLVFIVGPTINLHFCADKLESVNISGGETTCCCNGKSSCCENKTIKLKLNVEHTFTQIINNFNFKLHSTCQVLNFHILEEHNEIISFTSKKNDPPPIKYKNDLFLLNCSFTFYG